LPLSLSLVALELLDMLSVDDVVDELELDGDVDEDDEVLGDMLLELDVLPDGVVVVADDEVSVELDVDDGDVVDGLIVPVLLELEDGEVLGVVVVVVELELVAGVVDGVVVVDDVLLVSRWQPAAPSATVTAIATTARGFGFM